MILQPTVQQRTLYLGIRGPAQGSNSPISPKRVFMMNVDRLGSNFLQLSNQCLSQNIAVISLAAHCTRLHAGYPRSSIDCACVYCTNSLFMPIAGILGMQPTRISRELRSRETLGSLFKHCGHRKQTRIATVPSADSLVCVRTADPRRITPNILS